MRRRERIAYLICPWLRAEVEALRDGNTKVVIANGKLLDRVSDLTIELRSYLFDRRIPVSIRQSSEKILESAK